MSKQDYFENYFLINYLLKGNQKDAFYRSMIFFSIVFLFVFLMNYLDGSLIIRSDGEKAIGLIQDYANYFYFISFFLATYLFRKIIVKFVETFLWYTTSSEIEQKTAFNFTNCVKLDDNYKYEYQKFLDKQMSIILLTESRYRKRFYLLQFSILILFLATSVYLPIFTNQVNGNWNFSFSIYPLGFLSSQIKDFIFYVIILPPLFWGVTTVAISTIKICKKIDKDKKFDIRPLSPDRTGGLKQLGDLTLLLFYIVIIQFSHLFATSLILGFPISHQIIYPVYFGFTAFLFFYPINSVRKAMKEAKNEELDRVMKLFDLKYQEFRLVADNDISKVTKIRIKELLEIKSLYKQVEDMPIWPFDIDTLLKFASFFLIPILVFIIQLLVNADSIIYNLDKLKIFENF